MNKTESRIKNSKKGLIFALIHFIIKLLFAFIVRKIFLLFLNETFLGVDTLFVNILDVLCFAELGIGSAMDCMLFKPAYEKDYKKMSQLMTLFKKIYFIIGVIVIVGGLITTPFIHLFMNEYPFELNTNFYIIFVMFVFNAGLSYLFTYRFSLFHAYQKKSVHYIIMIINYTTFSILQILSLVVFHSYYLFVASKLVYTVGGGLLAFIATKKLFREVQDNDKDPLDLETKSKFKKEVGGVVLHKVATVVNTSADGIIISKFLDNGVTTLGIYSCYLMVTSALNGLVLCVCDALRGSIGNLISSNNLENGNRVFSIINLLFWWGSMFASTAVLCLINPFLKLFLNMDNLFGFSTIFIISFNFFVNSSKQGAWIVRESYGHYEIDKYKNLIQALINIILSISLVFVWGINGVLIATILSCLFTSTWWEPYIVLNKWLKKPLKPYMIKYFGFMILSVALMLLTYYICSFISVSFVGLLLKALICLTVPNLIFVICFGRTKSFKELMKILFSMLPRKRRVKNESNNGI